MTTPDLIQETHTALSANKVRSGLTMLGIIIGISSVITMVAIGQGAQGTIETSIQSIGSNLIMVIPGMQKVVGLQVSQGRGSAKTLTKSDADDLRKNLQKTKAVAPELSGRYQVTSKGKNTNTSVNGVTSDYISVRNIEIDSGSFITDQNLTGLSRVAVIGPTTKTDLFGEDVDPVGQTIRIKGVEFKIIGVTKAKGGSGFSNQDDIIFVPLSVAQRFFTGDSYVSMISIQADNAQSMIDIQDQTTGLLLDRHRIVDSQLADFTVVNQADIVATASSVTQTFTILLSAVAGISLLVGGIGIMNMMLTTVTERTREIGLRKAIGAKRKDINLQFLIEAVMLTFIGGFIGIVLGYSIASLISLTGVIQTKISFTSIILAFGVSTLIGIIFGYYPAKRAATLNPIEALKYE